MCIYVSSRVSFRNDLARCLDLNFFFLLARVVRIWYSCSYYYPRYFINCICGVAVQCRMWCVCVSPPLPSTPHTHPVWLCWQWACTPQYTQSPRCSLAGPRWIIFPRHRWRKHNSGIGSRRGGVWPRCWVRCSASSGNEDGSGGGN